MRVCVCTIFNIVRREDVSVGDICAVLKETREQHICRCLERGAHAEGAAGAKALGWKLFGSKWEPSVAGAQRASVKMVGNKNRVL